MGPPDARRAAHRGRASRAASRGRGRRGRAARGRRRSGRRGRLASTQPPGSGPRLSRVLAHRRDRGTGAPPGRAPTKSHARWRPSQPSVVARSRRAPARHGGDRVLVRTGTTGRRVVDVRIERHAEGRAAHPGDARVQGRHHGPGPRTRPGRLHPDAGAVRAHQRPAERDHASRRSPVPQHPDASVGSRTARSRSSRRSRSPSWSVRRRSSGALMDAAGLRPARVASLRLISSGGAGVSTAFVEEAEARLGARVKRTYGSTEAPTVLTDGLPIAAAELQVAADGELLVRGPEVCVGYLDPADNEDAFTADGWFRTGDLATLDARPHRDRRSHQGRHHPRRREHQHRRRRSRPRGAPRDPAGGRGGLSRSADGRTRRGVRRHRRRVRRRRGAGLVRRRVVSRGTRRPNGSSSSHRCHCSRPGSRTARRYAVRSSQGEVSTPIILKPLMTALGFNAPGFQW